MNISFRRTSTANTPDKRDDEEEPSLSKKSSFTFGDMGKNLNFKKMFSDKDSSSLKRSKSGAEDDSVNERIKEIMSLLEEFRLQCPPTHAGLVVAFTATTLSPLSDPDIKYKWYRMDKEQDQFLQIDQGSRAWYPPTADDIGKKICAQCEDGFEQGYCRYAETGPVEADPLLRSMLDSALENGSYALKDVSISLGINVLDAEVNAMVVSFDMQAKQRLSSLEQSPSPIGSGGFAQFDGRCEVEVDTTGIFLSVSDTADKKGLKIKSSPSLLAECALPASLIVTIALPPGDICHTGVGDNDEKKPVASEKSTAETESALKNASSHGASSEEVDRVEAAEIINESTPVENQPWEWVGEKSGVQYDQVITFFKNLGECVVPEFRICLACSDRMQRDAMALGIRSLAALGPDAGMRERMSVLPWIGVEHSNSSIQSMAGSELGTRLKDLENENKALKRERDELNLQILEHGMENGGRSTNRSASAEDVGELGTGEDNNNANRARIKQLESEILNSRRKEMEIEQNSLEKEARINRLTSENESKDKRIAELEQNLAKSNGDLNSSKCTIADMKSEIESMQAVMKNVSLERAETEEARSTLREMENELVCLRKSLSEAEARYDGQISETRVIAAELLAAQTKASEVANDAQVTANRCKQLEKELVAVSAYNEDLKLQCDSLLEQKKTLEEAAQAAELYEEALDSIDKLEGERNHWQHKSESLAKDVKRLLKQIEDLHNTTSYQLKESSRALEIRNEEFKNLEASIAAKNDNDTNDANGRSRRLSIFRRKDKKDEDA